MKLFTMKDSQKRRMSFRLGKTNTNRSNSGQEATINDGASACELLHSSTQVTKCNHCCQDFSTSFPFSFNIFLPGTKEVVRDFVSSRHRLTTSGLRCRLRMGLNTFDSGCLYGRERVLRVEGLTKDEVINCIDLLDTVFPEWKVWRRGKTDVELLWTARSLSSFEAHETMHTSTFHQKKQGKLRGTGKYRQYGVIPLNTIK